jgi:hypothetical protein
MEIRPFFQILLNQYTDVIQQVQLQTFSLNTAFNGRESLYFQNFHLLNRTRQR